MTYSNGVVDPNFIMLTSAPSHDRAIRRRFIRHRVMLNYHAQRASKKRTETSTSASKSNRAENGENASQQDLAEAPSATKSTRAPEKMGADGSADACALTTPTGRIGIAASSILRPVESANLLQPRMWADARDRWSSETVMRFLCGQVGRGVRNAGIGGVVFVHGSVDREMIGTEKGNCLREWQELVKKYSTVDGNVDMESAELWEKVFEAQERIYMSVNMSLFLITYRRPKPQISTNLLTRAIVCLIQQMAAPIRCSSHDTICSASPSLQAKPPAVS